MLSQTGAQALPSFAIQTGNPCAACHVGAFGPQLTSFGRDFKLYGYVASDNKPHFPPLAFMVQTGYTRSQTPTSSPAGEGSRLNDNWSMNEATLYYGGAIIPNYVGGFIQGTYDGVAHSFGLNTSDIRFAKDGTIMGKDMVWGISLNNSPTMSDIWNSTPNWGYPYVNTPYPVRSVSGTAIEGTFAKNVAGIGPYISWNDLIYAEAAVYKQLGTHDIGLVQGTPTTLSAELADPMPYWRFALQNDWQKGKYYAQLGTYGLTAAVNPSGDHTTGKVDRYNDFGVDANFQWYQNTKSVVANVLSAHATWIREDQRLGASSRLTSTNPSDKLNTIKGDVSFSYHATWTPTFQYFKTIGTTDTALYSSTTTGSPNSEGWVAELGFTPWGKPDSPVNWYNTRITLQYTNYNQFNGTSTHATDNNIIYLNIWNAFGLNPF